MKYTCITSRNKANSSFDMGKFKKFVGTKKT